MGVTHVRRTVFGFDLRHSAFSLRRRHELLNDGVGVNRPIPYLRLVTRIGILILRFMTEYKQTNGRSVCEYRKVHLSQFLKHFYSFFVDLRIKQITATRSAKKKDLKTIYL